MALKALFKTVLHSKLTAIFSSAGNDDEILNGLEELLILADISLPVVTRVMANLKKTAGRNRQKEAYLEFLRQELLAVFPAAQRPALARGGKDIILLVGVNGSGKTTSAAKLARYLQRQGRSYGDKSSPYRSSAANAGPTPARSSSTACSRGRTKISTC
jgi:fused signal recognition particle receptor